MTDKVRSQQAQIDELRRREEMLAKFRLDRVREGRHA